MRFPVSTLVPVLAATLLCLSGTALRSAEHLCGSAGPRLRRERPERRRDAARRAILDRTLTRR